AGIEENRCRRGDESIPVLGPGSGDRQKFAIPNETGRARKIMINTGKHLSRRTMLRGLGVSIALPMLDSMVPALAAPARLAGQTPVRLGFTYVPNGMCMADWNPKTPGKDFEITPILKQFEPFKN